MAGTFRFTFGPWNIHEGADPFGPEVREPLTFDQKLPLFKKLGFDGVQVDYPSGYSNPRITFTVTGLTD
jgi:xylose isomerase